MFYWSAVRGERFLFPNGHHRNICGEGGRDLSRPEQSVFLVTRRGRERLRGIVRCASAAMKGAGTDVLGGNQSR